MSMIIVLRMTPRATIVILRNDNDNDHGNVNHTENDDYVDHNSDYDTPNDHDIDP